ncbi:MAG: hypothetical protein AAF899_00170 [Pseudomonadota bacterium]
MRLTEAGPGPVPTPPLPAFKEHLRLGFGFTDDGSEDGLIQEYLSAAVMAVERRTARALVARDFVLVVSGPDADGCVAVPIGPVSGIVSAVIRDGSATTALDVAGWRVTPGETGQRIGAVGGALPVPAAGARLEIVLTAGLGADWTGVPGDLAQAVLILAADFYSRRGTEGAKSLTTDLPAAFTSLTDAWRPLRV